MTILWSNNASSTVSGSITAASTTVALAAGTGAEFPNPTGGNYFVATFYDQATKTINEIVHCTARSGDVCTIVRGQEGTTPQAWNAGDIFANLVTAGTLEAFVQAGTGPANTSIMYVGTDTSVTPNHIVCETNPVPSNYAIGMLFNIKIANNNNGPTDLALNGLAAVLAKRTDGSDFVGGEFTAGEEYIFIYNGTNFTSTIPPIPLEPPQTIFYVRTDGNDNNSGFANTPTAAFQTVQGAINAIENRYISQKIITVRVNDGTYTSGWTVNGQYIVGWEFIGDTANPQNCVINATSTNPSSYVTGAPKGVCCSVGSLGQMIVTGFTFQSYLMNVLATGYVELNIINFTGPTSGDPIISGGGPSADIYLHGNCNFSTTNSLTCLFSMDGGQMSFGYTDPNWGTSSTLDFAINNAVTVTEAVAVSQGGAVMIVYNANVGFTGAVPTGKQYLCSTAGGIAFDGPATAIPGTQPGVVTTSSATDCGGWLNHS
jgi:hypothetical protein